MQSILIFLFDGLKQENVTIDTERKAVTLSWDEALSTVGSLKYHIYDNEALTNPIAVTTSLTYGLIDLATNKTFRFLPEPKKATQYKLKGGIK